MKWMVVFIKHINYKYNNKKKENLFKRVELFGWLFSTHVYSFICSAKYGVEMWSPSPLSSFL